MSYRKGAPQKYPPIAIRSFEAEEDAPSPHPKKTGGYWQGDSRPHIYYASTLDNHTEK